MSVYYSIMAADLRSALKSLRTNRSELSPPLPKIPNVSTTDQEISNNNNTNPSTGSLFYEEYDDDIFKDIDLFDFSCDGDDLNNSCIIHTSPPNSSSFLSSINTLSHNHKRPSSTHNHSSSSHHTLVAPPIQSVAATPTFQQTHVSLNTPVLPSTAAVSSSIIRSMTTPTTVVKSIPSITCNSLITPTSHSSATPISQFSAIPTSHSLATPISQLSDTSTITTRNLSLSQRKFPGPAGCLPKLTSLDRLQDTPLPAPSTLTPASTPIIKKVSTQSTVNNTNEFTRANSPWIVMMNELDLTDPLSKKLLDIDIASVTAKARKHELVNGKVSHLRVLIKTIIPSTRSATAVLMDPSGEILATVHASVLDEYKTELVQGCAAVLRQLSIFSPSPRKHYLNVTLDNIVRLYPPTNGQTVRRDHDLINLTTIEKRYNEQENLSNSINTFDHHQRRKTSSSHVDSSIEDDFDNFFEDVDINLLDL